MVFADQDKKHLSLPIEFKPHVIFPNKSTAPLCLSSLGRDDLLRLIHLWVFIWLLISFSPTLNSLLKHLTQYLLSSGTLHNKTRGNGKRTVLADIKNTAV